MKEKIVKLVFESLEYVTESVVKQNVNTVLYGSGSELDSLDFVRLIITIEQRIYDEYGRSVSLTTEKAMSSEHSPFRTVESLTEYILTLLDE